ncbi:hypothetical protein G6O69_14215 [Pseudenhygromyxa sp. WMMC2535]|uniref:hypothetical protein n=1 Tax=Pseudenhygromyxa sp. WMMC2535 TaxID=2712867 RepID=UPI001557CE74|nr:hypothetical protein [Pseudenhygromyxa sp. WMMC2535]NVB38993.1 hypothetical protein [Pseudenhygromyxa sp. WMMC2535]
MAKREDKAKSKRKGGRTTAFAGLIAVIALIAAWLSDCIPGLGSGVGEDAPGEAEAERVAAPEDDAQTQDDVQAKDDAQAEAGAAEAGAAEAGAAEQTLRAAVSVDASGSCRVAINDAAPGEAVACASLCDGEDPFSGAQALTIDAKQGPHAAVVAVMDCAKASGIDELAITVERD